jgi:nicotinic acid mononucleotide adenylyltransferase
MGGDQWAVIDQWLEPQRLASCVEFIVFSRGTPLAQREGTRLHELHASHPASATSIRSQIARGQIRHPWLDEKVSSYIAAHGLYRAAQ